MVIYIEGLKCNCEKGYVRIDDSYTVKERDIPNFVEKLRVELKLTKFTYKRTKDSWVKEWIAHNRLYKLGLFRKHTKDVDLYENESKFALFCYDILSIGRGRAF